MFYIHLTHTFFTIFALAFGKCKKKTGFCRRGPAGQDDDKVFPGNAALLEVHAHASGKPRHDNFHAASCWRGRLDSMRRPGSLYDDFVRDHHVEW